MPLQGSRVIPSDWSAHHAGTAQGGMTATCRIHTAPTGPVWNETTGTMTPGTGTKIYEGACRVQRKLGDSAHVQAGDPGVSRSYLVAIPLSATAAITDTCVVTIVSCPNDPSLPGRRMAVRDVMRGSERFQRDLMCEDVIT